MQRKRKLDEENEEQSNQGNQRNQNNDPKKRKIEKISPAEEIEIPIGGIHSIAEEINSQNQSENSDFQIGQLKIEDITKYFINEEENELSALNIDFIEASAQNRNNLIVLPPEEELDLESIEKSADSFDFFTPIELREAQIQASYKQLKTNPQTSEKEDSEDSFEACTSPEVVVNKLKINYINEISELDITKMESDEQTKDEEEESDFEKCTPSKEVEDKLKAEFAALKNSSQTTFGKPPTQPSSESKDTKNNPGRKSPTTKN